MFVGWVAKKCSCCDCPTIFYVTGGNTGTIQKFNSQYNRTGTAWASKTDFPSPVRYGHGGLAIASLGYIFFGGDTLGSRVRDCDEYSPPVTNTWASKTDGPTPARYLQGYAETGGIGYQFGGQS